MLEIKFMTGFSQILWKDWWPVCLLGAHAVLWKASTAPKEHPMITSLGWCESAGLHPGCATSVIPLKPVDGRASNTSPAPPQARQRRTQFLLGLTGSQNVFASSRCWMPPGVVSSCNLWLLPWVQILFPFFPTESWENRRWLVAYLHLWLFCGKVYFFVFTSTHGNKKVNPKLTKANTLGLLPQPNQVPVFLFSESYLVKHNFLFIEFTKGCLWEGKGIMFISP